MRLKNLDGRCRWNTEAMPPAHKSARATRHAIFGRKLVDPILHWRTPRTAKALIRRVGMPSISRRPMDLHSVSAPFGERDRPPSVRFEFGMHAVHAVKAFRRAPFEIRESGSFMSPATRAPVVQGRSSTAAARRRRVCRRTACISRRLFVLGFSESALGWACPYAILAAEAAGLRRRAPRPHRF